MYTVQYVLSNPNILLLTSRVLALKIQELVLTLNITQDAKNAMRPREVKLQKGPRGWELRKNCWNDDATVQLATSASCALISGRQKAKEFLLDSVHPY